MRLWINGEDREAPELATVAELAAPVSAPILTRIAWFVASKSRVTRLPKLGSDAAGSSHSVTQFAEVASGSDETQPSCEAPETESHTLSTERIRISWVATLDPS